MRLTHILLAAALSLFSASAGDIRAHYTAPSLDVYVDSSVETVDIPAAAEHHSLIASVKTTDQDAVAVSVWIMIRLDDQTRIVRSAVMRNTPDGGLVFRFPIPRRAIELVAIDVNNLHRAGGDILTRLSN